MKNKESYNKLDYTEIIEKDLAEIKKCKIHILMLEEQNNKLCQQNNIEIEKLNKKIEENLKHAEEYLTESKARKIETSSGWVAFRTMPDMWEYDEQVLLDWVKSKGLPYYHTLEVLEKQNIKKAIQDNKIKLEEVRGIKVIPQEPKFHYRLKGGGEIL